MINDVDKFSQKEIANAKDACDVVYFPPVDQYPAGRMQLAELYGELRRRFHRARRLVRRPVPSVRRRVVASRIILSRRGSVREDAPLHAVARIPSHSVIPWRTSTLPCTSDAAMWRPTRRGIPAA